MNRSTPRPALTLLASLAAGLLVAACGPSDGVTPPPTDAPLAAPAVASIADMAATLGFRKQVTVDGIREHLTALDAIAAANGGNRAIGLPGYDASAQYVRDRLTAAGYDARLQAFSFSYLADRTPPVLQRVSPAPTTYVDGVDFATMSYSGNGDVTAPVYAVDFLVPVSAPNVSTSGCEAADFAGFPAGAIALLQRGTCTFRVKAQNAAAAGATGVIIANDGAPGRTGPTPGTLEPPQFNKPVVGASFAVGEALRNGVLNGPTGAIARVRVDWVAETRTANNVIAESRGGDPSRVVLLGAQLASARTSPGINAATGAATVLEIAEEFARVQPSPNNRVRFVWFGGVASLAGEAAGAAAYTASLSSAEAQQIAAALVFDRLGSPNFGRFVLDGDNSQFAGVVAPAGSGAIEQLFTEYFQGSALATRETSLATVDALPFVDLAVPVGGVWAGGAALKSAEEASVFGGTAGVAFDPCLNQACDTSANVSLTALDQLSDAVAHAMLSLARRNFVKNPF